MGAAKRAGRVRALGWTWVMLGFVVGCHGAAAITDTSNSATATEASSASGSATTGPAGTVSGTTSSTSGAVDDTHSTTSNDPTHAVFLSEPDGGPSFQCDLFAQDCPPGEKCTVWANGGGSLDGTKCAPVVDDPVGAGEPCHVEGSPSSGIDDCDFGAVCLYADPETLEGICVAFCVGEESDAYCEDRSFECSLGGDTLPLCFPRCNPGAQDCFRGQGCYAFGNGWKCVPDASGAQGAYGDPCEHVNVCDPGLVCLEASSVPRCAGAIGCCTEVCDVTDPLGDLQCAGAAGGQICQPWYEMGTAPAGYEDVGVCMLPS